MKVTAALAADLGILTAALDEPGTDVAHSLRQLVADATAAVPTFLGLSITVTGSDPPFTFTVLVEDAATGDIRTSLMLVLSGVGDVSLPTVVTRLVRGVAGDLCRSRRGHRVAHRPAAE